MSFKEKWSLSELANAMESGARSQASKKYIRASKDKLLFNGFWRDGDKPNVCIWLNKATWADAKTGAGGGCKEFAKVAFNLNLPEFMARFGSHHQVQNTSVQIKPILKPRLLKPVEKIFQELSNKDKTRKDYACDWLKNERGLIEPKSYISSGFANLNQIDINIFEIQHRPFIQERLKISPQMIVPLRSPHSDVVENLFFRSIAHCPKEDKTRLLPNANGWQQADGTPRAFGFPHLINKFSKLILCEGMADYFAAEMLLEHEHNFLPIGVASASALPKWAHWLIEEKYNGNVMVIFHLDKDKHGNLSDGGIGQENAIKCINQLHSAGISAKLFPWLKFLKQLNNFTDIRDLADALKLAIEPHHLQNIFLQTINEGVNA